MHLYVATFYLCKLTHIKNWGFPCGEFELYWAGFGPLDAVVIGVPQNDVCHKQEDLVY